MANFVEIRGKRCFRFHHPAVTAADPIYQIVFSYLSQTGKTAAEIICIQISCVRYSANPGYFTKMARMPGLCRGFMSYVFDSEEINIFMENILPFISVSASLDQNIKYQIV